MFKPTINTHLDPMSFKKLLWLLLAIATLAVVWCLLIFFRYPSGAMEPTIQKGAIIMAVRYFDVLQLEANDIVLYELPASIGRTGDGVARITKIVNEKVYLAGDSQSAYDSRHFGPVDKDSIKARVVYWW